VLARIRGWFDGAGWFLAGAGLLFFVALLFALLALQSASALMWTGQAVTGTEQQGIAYYNWKGQSYTLDAPDSGSASRVTVYINPGDPTDGIVYRTSDRVATIALVGGPALAGVALIILGGTRNYRWKRRNATRGTSDWWLSKVPPPE
jgi:hypothetical protein